MIACCLCCSLKPCGGGGVACLFLAAARALIDQDLEAEEIGHRAMTIAADMCVYTNHNFISEEIVLDEQAADKGKKAVDKKKADSKN